MTERNTKAMEEYNKSRSEDKEKDVMNAINKLRREKDNFSLSDVCKVAKCSRAYIYKNEKLLEIINQYRDSNTHKKVQSKDSKDVLINTLKAKIKLLEKEIESLKQAVNYKEKYETLKDENEKLKKQLAQAYVQKLDIDF